MLVGMLSLLLGVAEKCFLLNLLIQYPNYPNFVISIHIGLVNSGIVSRQVTRAQ